MHDNDTTGPLAAFRLYTEAFQTLDPAAAARYFHEPAIFITPDGVVALPTVATVEAHYDHIMSGLPARGYARTAFSALNEQRLSEDLAQVSGDGVWKNASDEDLMPFGMTYTLRRTDKAWRIVVAAIHAPQNPRGGEQR